jgi:hypothetical protein
MGDSSKFDIPETCREFGENCFEIRLQVAKNFVQEFTKHVAPEKGLDNSNEAWTRSVRKRFIEVCPDKCYAIPSDFLTAKGEYLVDYAWEEMESGKRVLMAAESEWGADRYGRSHWNLVEQDFEKLLPIKAPFKVLIFSSDQGLAVSQSTYAGNFAIGFAKTRLRDSLKNYGHHLPGEVYIFIDFPRTGRAESNGVYQSFIWIATGHRMADPVFQDGGCGPLTRPSDSK